MGCFWQAHRVVVIGVLAVRLRFGEAWPKQYSCTRAEILLLCQVAAFVSKMFHLCPAWNYCLEEAEWNATAKSAEQVSPLLPVRFAFIMLDVPVNAHLRVQPGVCSVIESWCSGVG